MIPAPPPHGEARVLLVGFGVCHMRAIVMMEPLGIGCVGAALREAGYQVRLHHMLDGEEPLFDLVRRFRPAIIGLSCYTSNWSMGQRVAVRLRSCFDGPIVLGGIHATLNPGLALEPYLDVLVRGEGERTMVALCDALLAGKPELEAIPGLAFERAGELVDTGLSPRIDDLDSLPLAMREGLPMHRYKATVPWPRFGLQRAALVSASRGCEYACSFCTTPFTSGRRRVMRSVPNVLWELRWLARRFETNTLYFCDEDLAWDRDWLLALCAAIESARLGMSWYCFARATSLDPQLLAAMRRAGCSAVGVGIESPDPASLRRVGKGVAPEQLAQAVAWIEQAGIWSVGFFMLGLPWHDRATIEEAGRIVRSMRLGLLYPSYATPFPHTRLHREAEERGLIRVSDTDAYDSLAPVMVTEHLGLEELERLYGEVLRRFYGDPRWLARTTRRMLRDPVPALSAFEALGSKLVHSLAAQARGGGVP